MLLRVFFTLLLIFFCVGLPSYAGDLAVYQDEGLIKRMNRLPLYKHDILAYPYVVLGKIEYKGLMPWEARAMLKKIALDRGADAVIYYKNYEEYGSTAEGIAVRWQRKGEVGITKIDNLKDVKEVQ